MNTSPVEVLVRELAEGLRDAISDTASTATEQDPEQVYVDLAYRLVLKLSQRAITVAPSHRVTQDAAAARIFSILTSWMREHTNRSYVTQIGPSGRFEIIAKEGDRVEAFFGGESVQDAYAQAAQTIEFNGGTL